METKNKKNESGGCTCEGENCTTAHNHEHCDCEQKKEHECNCQSEANLDLAQEYLNMARLIQADFDNYRKRSIQSISQARQDGIISTVEVILPSLDIFKKAKDMIQDRNALKGIEMVENEIYNSLKTLGIEKIETRNKQFDPKLHEAIAVAEDVARPDGFIKEEIRAGYKFGDKVIRYSQVLVNRLKEEK